MLEFMRTMLGILPNLVAAVVTIISSVSTVASITSILFGSKLLPCTVQLVISLI